MTDIGLFWLALGGITIGGAFAAVILEWPRRPTGWQFYRILPFASIRLKDGSVATFEQLVMRRRLADGLWEYRWPTEQEAEQDWIERQW